MDNDLEARIASLSAESATMKTAAAEMLDKMRALEELVSKLLNPAPPAKPSGVVVALKTAGFDSHYSTETIRRAALSNPAVGTKSGGKWQIDMVALEAHLAAKRR